MFVKQKVNECDFTGRKYNSAVDGAGALAKGATGRVCVVMYAGPEYLAENNVTPLSYEDAVKKTEEQGGYPDF